MTKPNAKRRKSFSFRSLTCWAANAWERWSYQESWSLHSSPPFPSHCPLLCLPLRQPPRRSFLTPRPCPLLGPQELCPVLRSHNYPPQLCFPFSLHLLHLLLPHPDPHYCCCRLQRQHTQVQHLNAVMNRRHTSPVCSFLPISSSPSSSSSAVLDETSSMSSSTVFTFLSPLCRNTLWSSTCIQTSIKLIIWNHLGSFVCQRPCWEVLFREWQWVKNTLTAHDGFYLEEESKAHNQVRRWQEIFLS